MKSLLFALAVLLSQPVFAARNLAVAVNVDQACMFRHLYANSSQDLGNAGAQRDAADTCIGFSQGGPAWYLEVTRVDGKLVGPDSVQAQASLKTQRDVGVFFLSRAVPTCRKRTLAECLAVFKLTDVPE
jgi:hypothetical protein